VILIALLGASGVGLLARKPWAVQVTRVASIVALVLGLVLIGILAITASYLSGIYGPVGRGGAIILALVAALALPYLVALPVSQLLWLGWSDLTRMSSVPALSASQAPRAKDERAPEAP
jgi:hypothetical protein